MAGTEATWCRNTELKGVFDALPESEKGSVHVLEGIIKTRVGINLPRRTLRVPKAYLRFFGNLRAKQYPNELAQFLAFLYARRTEVCTYLEIGVEHCGTFYTVDSYLRSVNPAFRSSTALDEAMEMCRFEEYEARYDCRFHQGRSADYVLREPVDLAFIDADHSYAGVSADFELVRRKARYVALHDVACVGVRGVEVKAFWDRIKGSHTHLEFLNRDPAIPGCLGIGVLLLGAC